MPVCDNNHQIDIQVFNVTAAQALRLQNGQVMLFGQALNSAGNILLAPLARFVGLRDDANNMMFAGNQGVEMISGKVGRPGKQ